MELKKSTTSQIVQVFFLDTTSVIGAGKTGLAYNTAGLTCYYKRNKGSASVALTLATMTLGTWASGGFKEVDAAHMPGLYEFGVPDAALATGADGASEMTIMFALSGHEAVTRPLRFDLIALDKQDTVRAGLTALPNAAAAANGGLATADGSNAVKIQSGTGANQVALSSGAVTVGTNNDKSSYGLADGAITAAKIASAALDAAALAADALDAVAASVLDAASNDHDTAGTIGAQINAAGDPLASVVPGAYASGTAGFKLGLLGAGVVTVSAPVNAQSGDLVIVRGDDYTVSSGRTLPEWSSDGWTPFSLTTAESITLRAQARYGETVFEKAGAAVSNTQVRVELTSAETGGLAVGRAAYRFDLVAVLATGDVVTLAQGHISVTEDVD